MLNTILSEVSENDMELQHYGFDRSFEFNFFLYKPTFQPIENRCRKTLSICNFKTIFLRYATV